MILLEGTLEGTSFIVISFYTGLNEAFPLYGYNPVYLRVWRSGHQVLLLLRWKRLHSLTQPVRLR